MFLSCSLPAHYYPTRPKIFKANQQLSEWRLALCSQNIYQLRQTAPAAQTDKDLAYFFFLLYAVTGAWSSVVVKALRY